MVDEQSAFIGSQSALQAPPSPTPDMLPVSPTPNPLRKRLMVVVVIGAIIILLLIVALLLPKRSSQTALSTPPPSPSPTPALTELQQQLMQNDSIVEQSNPENTIYLPPDVDMEVTF